MACSAHHDRALTSLSLERLRQRVEAAIQPAAKDAKGNDVKPLGLKEVLQANTNSLMAFDSAIQVSFREMGLEVVLGGAIHRPTAARFRAMLSTCC